MSLSLELCTCSSVSSSLHQTIWNGNFARRIMYGSVWAPQLSGPVPHSDTAAPILLPCFSTLSLSAFQKSPGSAASFDLQVCKRVGGGDTR